MTDDVVYSYEAVESYVEGAGIGWCSIMLLGDGTSSFRVLRNDDARSAPSLRHPNHPPGTSIDQNTSTQFSDVTAKIDGSEAIWMMW